MPSSPETAALALVGGALEAWRMNTEFAPIHVSWVAEQPPTVAFVARQHWHPGAEGRPIDLEDLDDEELVVRAAESADRAARDELLRRFLPQMTRFICRQATRTGLQDADKQDAQQEAVLWILEAICRYRTREQAHPGGCHFSSFLHRVLTARFIDVLRRRQRQRSHFPLTAEDAVDAGQYGRPGSHGGPGSWATRDKADPARKAEQDEWHGLLMIAVARLDEPARQLWTLLAEGTPLRDAARVLNLSYDTIKRRRRELLAKLRALLPYYHGE